MFHLKTLYWDDESQPGYAYSGSSLRSATVARLVAEAVGARGSDVVEVRMRRPLARAPMGKRAARPPALLEPRFALRSLIPRVFMGGAGALGSKDALFVMDYAGNSFDSGALFRRLKASPSPKVVVIDGLSSFSFLGKEGRGENRSEALWVYLSHDYEPDFVTNRALAAMARSRIDFALENCDIVVAASHRDRLRYLAHGKLPARDIVVYPNIFPPQDEAPPLQAKTGPFTVASVQSRWSGRSGALEDAKEIASALGLLPGGAEVRVIAFGPDLPGLLRGMLQPRFELEAIGQVPGRGEFIQSLARAHVGINLGRWMGGTNVKKYDYAIAGAVVLSNSPGSRGELLAHEYAFADRHDLAAKLCELSERPRDEVARMGQENRAWVEGASAAAGAELGGAIRRMSIPARSGVR